MVYLKPEKRNTTSMQELQTKSVECALFPLYHLSCKSQNSVQYIHSTFHIFLFSNLLLEVLFTVNRCDEVVRIEQYLLKFVHNHPKNQQMCNEVMYMILSAIFPAPDYFKTQEVCIKADEANP